MTTKTPFLPPDFNCYDSIEQEAKNAIAYFKAMEFYQASPEASTIDCMRFLEKEGF